MPILKHSIIVKFCTVYFLLTLYSICIAILGGERITPSNLIMVPIELGCCTLLVLSILRRENMKSDKLIDLIIVSGIIQSLICCAMVAWPDFRNAINEFRSQYWDDRLIGWSRIRLLGFADGLFHTTPIIQAIISILLIKKAEQHPILYVFVITTLISAVLNSRTSFIIWIFCFIIYIYSDSNYPKKKKKNLIIIFLGALLIPFMIFSALENYVPGAMEYFYNGMDEIGDAAHGKNNGFFSYLDRYSITPNGLDFLFGIGCDTYGTINNAEYRSIHTDYGFYNDIWIYGIIGCSIMILLYLKTILNCIKLKNSNSKLIVGCLLIAFVVGHFKGIITYFNDYTALLLLISSSSVLDYKLKISKNIGS